MSLFVIISSVGFKLIVLVQPFFMDSASEGAFCGNKIVEVGEECDCGYDDDECKEHCCYPRVISPQDLNFNSSAVMCARRANTQCRWSALSL